MRRKKIKPVPDIYIVDLLTAQCEVREHIYNKIKVLHDRELALFIEAKNRLKKYIGQK